MIFLMENVFQESSSKEKFWLEMTSSLQVRILILVKRGRIPTLSLNGKSRTAIIIGNNKSSK